MSLRSLRLRLLVGAGVAVLISLLVAWLAMTLLFARHLERRDIEELDRYALQLIPGLHISAEGRPTADTPPTDSRFQRPASGLYWQVSAGGVSLRSVSLWDQDLPTAAPARDRGWHTRVVTGPFEDKLLLYERHLQLAGREVVVQLAQDEASSSAARTEFAGELMAFLAALWLVLSAAAALQVHLGLKPLARVRAALTALRHNPSERLVVDEHPPEVAPLIASINELAQAREQDLQRARRRAGDLAHGLKTPLAVLAAQSRRVRECGCQEEADGMDKAINAAAATLEAELTRARAAIARQESAPPSVPAYQLAERVINVVERTEAGEALVFENDIPKDLILPLSPEELSEILGALTENASRFARRLVRLSAQETPAAIRLSIADDGPGLNDWQTADALIRGRRLDQSGAGHGLGLAIATDLVEARGGSLTLNRSDLGGLAVEMVWPRLAA